MGGPTVITLSEAELGLLLGSVFPLKRRLLELLDLQLSEPKLRLLPGQNRLSLTMSLSTQERLFGQVASGQLVLDSALRYDARDASIRLTQVRVAQLNLEAGAAVNPSPAAPPGTSGRISHVLAVRALEDLTIYRVPAERQARLRQLGLQPGAVTVTSRGVEITLAASGA